jgi:hypothetical protein
MKFLKSIILLLATGNPFVDATTTQHAESVEAQVKSESYQSGERQFVAAYNKVCETFAVHAGTAITFGGTTTTTIHNGDVGVSPGTAITGTYEFEDGGEVVNDSSGFAGDVLEQHGLAMAVRTDGKTMAIEMGGQKFMPGTYRSGSAINVAHGTVVTLDGNNEANPKFLFQAVTTLVTAADTSFVLINGAKAENVLWALGTAATLGARCVLEGSILAGTDITFNTKSELHGCALAQAGVTFEDEGTIKNPNSGTNGDPHFKTWKGEHFEYHGQCDMVLAKDPAFASGLGIDVQIRTKLVRFWSYIKVASIRIGDDILEVEGNADPEDLDTHYWMNLEYQGEINSLGGFPVTATKPLSYKRKFDIDLGSKYPNQKIVIATYKEFVSVNFENGTEESFGKTVGLLGDFKTGKTLARDGATIVHDFWEYGSEWQVLPVEDMLFHDVSAPQFPKKCIEPEDPRGDRRRRLGEMTVTEEQAEAACARLKDAADRKDCVYDILATQDLAMVGAY